MTESSKDELNALASILETDFKCICSMVFATETHYRSFKIMKLSGGLRNIESPYTKLYSVQKNILKTILAKAPIHSSAHGYVKNKSIKSNATMHLHGGNVLKIDIKDFFPSIKLMRVKRLFIQLGYQDKESYYLARLCTLRGCLPQGAPTSPAISNAIMYSLDYMFTELANDLNAIYTRYADDIVFSGTLINEDFKKEILSQLRLDLLQANLSKTKLITQNRRVIVTGIQISNGILRLPKSKRRQLRMEAHIFAKHGIENMPYFDGSYEQTFARLIGKLNYWKFIEPNNFLVKTTLASIYENRKLFIS